MDRQDARLSLNDTELTTKKSLLIVGIRCGSILS